MPRKPSAKADATPLSGEGGIDKDRLSTLDILAYPVWIFDIEGRAMWWANDQAVRLWNSDSLDALLARDWASDMSDATAARLDDYLNQFANGKTVPEQWTFYPKGEGAVTVHCICSGVRIADARLAMLVEGRRIESTEINERDLRGIEALRHTSVMISLYDKHGVLLVQNPSDTRMFTGAKSGRNDFCRRFEDSDDGERAWRETLESGYHTGEYRFVTELGVKWHGIDCNRTTDPVTGETAILVNQRDINRQRWAETIIAWSAKVLAQIAANKPLAAVLTAIVEMTETTEPGLICSILLLDEDGRHLRHGAAPSLPDFYNEAIDGLEIGPGVGSCGAAAFTGKRTIVEDVLTHPYWKPFRDLATRAGVRACWSDPIKDVSGRVIGTFAMYYRIPRPPDDGHLKLIRTASDLVNLAIEHHYEELELIKARQRAEAANEAKSLFVAKMSHEFRTPLNAILGFSELMIRQAFGQVDDPHYVEYARDIHDSGTLLLGLINDILDLSKIESGQVELHEEDVDIVETIDFAINTVRERAVGAGISLTREEPEQQPRLHGDRRMMRQILLNILSNAVKFTPSGGSITVRVAEPSSGGVTIEVQDTGVGIEPQNLEKIFEPFYQVDCPMTRQHEGTGLGVPVTKSLVELHGGTFVIDSTPGKGTTVTISFPVDRLLTGTIHSDGHAHGGT